MGYPSRYLNQKAVLWAASGTDESGSVTVSAAVEINVRWEEKQSQVLDAQGQVVAVDITVVIDQDIAVNSLLWLGAKEDLADVPVDLKQVIGRNKVPTLRKGRTQKYRRTVGVIRYSNELPTIV